MMIERLALKDVYERLNAIPAVVLLGARQVGKTTLAKAIATRIPSIYVDLESAQGRAMLSEVRLFVQSQTQKLIILDEVQRMPGIFEELRGIIDERRAGGRPNGQFLLLGSASRELLRQSGESLAGRVSYLELSPISMREVDVEEINSLWLRGGFPESYLASNPDASPRWRRDFIKTCLERDIPTFGIAVPSESLRRFWTMIAHLQGSTFNASSLARSLELSPKTASRYVELLVDLLLVRRLEPWSGSVGKRLIRAPKVYIRDSGMCHALLGVASIDALLSHPVVGASWEGFVIENAPNSSPDDVNASFYRTQSGAEVDLVLEFPSGETWAVEIKKSLSPRASKGFYIGSADIGATRTIIAYPGDTYYHQGGGVEVVPVVQLCEELAARRD